MSGIVRFPKMAIALPYHVLFVSGLTTFCRMILGVFYRFVFVAGRKHYNILTLFYGQ